MEFSMALWTQQLQITQIVTPTVTLKNYMVHLESRVLWIFFYSANLASKIVSLMYFKLPVLCSHNTPQFSLSVGLSMHFKIVKSLFITYTKQQTTTNPFSSIQINNGHSAIPPVSQSTQVPNFVSITYLLLDSWIFKEL